jgi:hypothetical protein
MCADGSNAAREFKYGSDLSQLKNCPPGRCQPVTREVYRFVKASDGFEGEMIDAESFVPPAKMKKKRVNRPGKPSCASMALSLFITEEGARKRYKELCIAYDDFPELVGDRLAFGTVKVEDGVQTHPNATGHVDLHEYAGVDLLAQFEIIGVLCAS